MKKLFLSIVILSFSFLNVIAQTSSVPHIKNAGENADFIEIKWVEKESYQNANLNQELVVRKEAGYKEPTQKYAIFQDVEELKSYITSNTLDKYLSENNFHKGLVYILRNKSDISLNDVSKIKFDVQLKKYTTEGL